jgi:opacity protein-like surface antigen
VLGKQFPSKLIRANIFGEGNESEHSPHEILTNRACERENSSQENGMKRSGLLFAVLLLFTGIASAQETPKVEVFGGYSYVRLMDEGATANFNGGSGSFSYNPTPWLGLVGDFGGYHWSNSGSDANIVTYMFGPKIAFRKGPLTPFIQELFGGGHISGTAGTDCGDARVRPQQIIGCGVSSSENGFAMALGGGLDWNATRHIGIRLVQAEYLLTKFNDGSNNRQNNLRISGGVVFRW